MPKVKLIRGLIKTIEYFKTRILYKTMAKVSIVMCCYNSERYIKETIDSVLNQTFTDYEFIIWNDGSTDSTEDIIMSYKDERILYFKDENRGEGKAANLACQHATSDYIARIDSDDIWLPTKLEVQYNYMEIHPEIVLSSFPVILIDADSKYIKHTFPITKLSYLNEHFTESNTICHSGSMYRTSAYRKVGGYSGVRFFQDYLLFRKLSDYGLISLLKEPLIKYRILPNSVAQKALLSDYYGILNAYVHKIILDKGTIPEDIDTFNKLYESIPKNKAEVTTVYSKNKIDVMFDWLKTILGEKKAYSLILRGVNAKYT